MKVAEFAEFHLVPPCSEKNSTYLIGRSPQTPQRLLGTKTESTVLVSGDIVRKHSVTRKLHWDNAGDRKQIAANDTRLRNLIVAATSVQTPGGIDATLGAARRLAAEQKPRRST